MHGCREGLHLGMGRRVTERFDEVMPRPTIRPDATTTAPIGTSSSLNALRASEIAARIKKFILLPSLLHEISYF